MYIYLFTFTYLQEFILNTVFFYKVTTFKKVEDLTIEGHLKLLATKTNKTNSYSL
jgi:hypothetical protein